MKVFKANNSQQFLVIDMLIAFGRNHALAVEGYRVKDTFIIIL